MRTFATLVIAVIAFVPQAFAQSELPRGLIGVSVTRATSDADSRMRLGQEARPWLFAGEMSARVAPWFAIGAEAIDFGAATGATSGRSFRSTGEQRERAILGLVRGRVAARERVAADLVGGAGVLFQRHMLAQQACFIECAPSFTGELTKRAPMFVFGFDVPVRLGPYLSIAAIGRYYFLRRRDDAPSGPTDSLPWQFESRPSSRIAIGASARVTW